MRVPRSALAGLLVSCLLAILPRCACGTPKAVILNLREWQTSNVNCSYDQIEACRSAKLAWPDVYGDGDVHLRTVPSVDVYPAQYTLYSWITDLYEATAADIITHGEDPNTGITGVAAEYYQNLSHFEQRWEYASEAYGSDIFDTELESGGETIYAIGWTSGGISANLWVDEAAIVVGCYSHSCTTWPGWNAHLDENAGAFLCHPIASSGGTSCAELKQVEDVLGCATTHPPTAGAAADVADTTELRGFADARYGWSRDCHRPTAAFDGVFAFDVKVVFRTVHEAGSFCFFVMGLDSWGDAGTRDWKSWDVLARVRPEGGRAAAHLYEVEGVPAKAVYRIVEVDRYGRPTFSPTFVRGTRPAEYDLWLAHPATAMADNEQGTSSELYGWVSGQRVLYDREVASPMDQEDTGSPDSGSIFGSRVDSSSCADIVVYTNADYVSLLPPVEDHLSNYPSKKVRYFLGGSSLDGAQVCYEDVYTANVFYNYWSGTDRYPTDSPGPLLLIVGDNSVVDHITFPDSHERCIGPCHSDRDATNVTGDGWCGLVHRIPCDEVEEVHRACSGAHEWNSGELVNPGRRVIQMAGDELGGSDSELVVEMAAAAAAKFMSEGYLTNPPLLDSDYAEDDYEGKRAAFNTQLENGAAVLWGYGRATTDCHIWPGRFMDWPDTTVHATQQRTIAIMPGCNTVAIYRYAQDWFPVLAERWMFNSPSSTQIVAILGHMDGGWEHQHRKAEELYMDAWAEAPEDAPLDWVVWRAAQMAEEQGLDWMTDYFRSAATMGAYVLARPGGDESTSIVVTDSDSLVFCPWESCGAGADSVTIIVTLRDGQGNPVVGSPAGRVVVNAVPCGTPNAFTFTCGDSCAGLASTAPTDENGQVFIPLVSAGGYDPAARLEVWWIGMGPWAETTIEAKSPDYDGDGDVD
ncbi:Ig-like domain-containing protein, partial [bacterium]|nr:Ig-like domain-containing protein [bacterium]